MSEQLLSPFESFDPLTGQPSHLYFSQTTQIINRARRQIKNRSREQIEYILQSVNYMLAYQRPQNAALPELDSLEDETIDWSAINASLTDSHYEDPKLDQQLGGPHQITSQHSEHYYLSPSASLQNRSRLFSISDQHELPGVRWSEYFAALALGLVGESKSLPLPHPISPDVVSAEFQAGYYAASYFIDAMEAVGQAEILAIQETAGKPAMSASNGLIRLNGHNGGIKANEQRNQIRRSFIHYVLYDHLPSLKEGEKLNRSAAAKAFYKESLAHNAPSDVEQKYRHQDNWVRSLKEAYREYEHKGELPQLPPQSIREPSM